MLNLIAADHPHDVMSCCKCVLGKWLDTTTDATWNQLIGALKSASVQLDYILEQNMMVTATQCKKVIKIKSTQFTYTQI